MTIILYDIPSKVLKCAWSPNTWKVRFALNFKGLPYKTEWVEYPDIKPHALKHGICHTSLSADGAPQFTLPAIHDTSTGEYIADSLLIIQYLEKIYPNTPSLLPNNTGGLQRGFLSAFSSNISPLWNFAIPKTNDILNPRSEEYFRVTREKSFGKKPLEDLFPKGEQGERQWNKLKEGLGNVDACYGMNGGKGPFLMGETASWADIVVASFLIWVRIVFGENSQQWKDITTWHDGRWKNLCSGLKQYETVV